MINEPFIKVRRRKSSISNSIKNSTSKLKDYKNQLLLMKEEGLIKNENLSTDEIFSQILFSHYINEGFVNGYKNIN